MLKQIYQDFNNEVKDSFQWIKAVNELAAITGSQLSNEQIYFAYEYAFLKVFVGWEKFIQDSFVSYIIGKRIKGHYYKTYLKNITEPHALELLSGTLPYPDWTKFEDIYKLAKLFFVDHEAFTLPFKEIEAIFTEIKKIRNVIVHMSSSAIDKFQGLLRANLPSYNINMKAGEFLNMQRARRKTFIEYYVSYLETAASKIIPS